MEVQPGPRQRGRGMHRHGRVSESAIHQRNQGPATGGKRTGSRGGYRTENFSSASNPRGQGRFGPGLQLTAQEWHSRPRRIRNRRPRVRQPHKTPLPDQRKKTELDIGQRSNSNGEYTERSVNTELPSSSGIVTKSSPAGARSVEVLPDGPGQQAWPGIAQVEIELQQAVEDEDRVGRLNVSGVSYQMTTRCGVTEGITPTPLFYARPPEFDHSSDNGFVFLAGCCCWYKQTTLTRKFTTGNLRNRHTYPDLEYNNSSRDLEAQKLFTLPPGAAYQRNTSAITTQLECLSHYHQLRQSHLDPQAPDPTVQQNYTPEYLYHQPLPDYLPSDSNPYCFFEPSFAYPVAPIRGRVSRGCTPASVAMSISSGEDPDFDSSYGKTDLNFHGEQMCIECKGLNAASNGLLVCCSRCYQCYHTSCHDPPVPVTRGKIDVDIGAWKCRWCMDRLVNSVSGSASRWPTPDQLFSLRDPNSRDGLSEKSIGLRSKGSTRMDLSPSDLGRDSPGGSWDGRYRSESHRHLARSPADWRRDDTTAGADDFGEFQYTAANRLENGSVSSSYPDEERGRSKSPHRNPTEEHETSRYGYQQVLTDPRVNANMGIEEREDAYYSDSSRSASISSAKPAVLTNNRPRSRSTSSNRYQDRGWYRATQAARDSRGGAAPSNGLQDGGWYRTPQTLGDSREGAILASGYRDQGWNESSQTVGDFREEDLTHGHHGWYPTSRPMGDLQEIEADLTDGSMSLDSPGGCSPGFYTNHSPRRFGDSHPVGLARGVNVEHVPNKPRESRGSVRAYSRAKDTNHDTISKGYDRKGSPPYAPSVGDHRRHASYRPGNRMIGTPSPPYSPPPPDPATKHPKSYPQGQHQPVALATSQVNRRRSSSLESMIQCRRCSSDMAHLDGRRGDVCQSCVRKEHCRDSAQPTLSHHDSSGAATTSHRPRASSGLLSTLGGNIGPKIPPSAPAAMRLSKSSLRRDLSFDNSPSTNPRPPPTLNPAPQTAKFQTAKQRVIEKYQMRVPELAKARSRSPQVKRTARKGQDKRKMPDLSKPGDPKAARIETTRRTKPANIPFRQKGPSLGSSLNNPPPPSALANTAGRPRSTAHEAPTLKINSTAKKPVRRGPAMKSAGGSVSRIVIDTSSDEGENISVLEKKLQEQKGFTRKQAEKAAELQIKLKESRAEKEKLRKELTAALAANQKYARQQDSRENKPLTGLVHRGQTHPGQKAAESDIPPQPDVVDGDERTPGSPKRLSMREFYSDLPFNSDSPWGTFELPDPDPKSFRKHGWRKTAYRPFDQARLMSVHLHRQVNRTKEPTRMLIQPTLDGKCNDSATSNTAALNGLAGGDVEMTDGIQEPGGDGHQIAFDEFMGIPDSMVPYVKDGSLGFRSGTINPRTGRLERNVPHYRIRVPGDLKASI